MAANPKRKPEKVAEPLPSESPAPAEVLMTKDGVTTEVRNNESVAIMAALGWQITEPLHKQRHGE